MSTTDDVPTPSPNGLPQRGRVRENFEPPNRYLAPSENGPGFPGREPGPP